MISAILKLIPKKFYLAVAVIVSLYASYFFGTFSESKKCKLEAKEQEIASLKAELIKTKLQIDESRKLRMEVKNVAKNGDNALPDDVISVLECLQNHRDGKRCTNGKAVNPDTIKPAKKPNL